MVCWIGVASMWVKDKIDEHSKRIGRHDERLIDLEHRVHEGMSNVG